MNKTKQCLAKEGTLVQFLEVELQEATALLAYAHMELEMSADLLCSCTPYEECGFCILLRGIQKYLRDGQQE